MAQLQTNSTLMNLSTLRFDPPPRVAIVHTEWNESIIAALNEGCDNVLRRFEAVITHKIAVPGSFELPFACKKIYEHAKSHPATPPEAIIAFGAAIRGGTPHFDYVSKAVTDGITQLNIQLSVPVIFGVLTLDNTDQAWERLGGVHGHKGEEAAVAALKMIHMCRHLR
jgi:6,7-dimethyl-8-ribityllumazine synthase